MRDLSWYGPLAAVRRRPGLAAPLADGWPDLHKHDQPEMNRYFWLLMRFIGDEHTLDERRVIYDRARNAFLEQLHSADPPFAPPKVAYERLAFEEAVRTVESSIARWGTGAKGREAPRAER